MWLIFARVNKKFRLNSSVIVSLNVMLPFVAYLLAEEFHVSGVIAVVVVGLIISRHKSMFSEEVRIQSKSVWSTAIFILGGLIFVLIGLTFPQVLKDISSQNILPLIGASFLIFLVAMIIRMIVIFSHKIWTEKRQKNIRKRFKELSESNKRFDKRFEEKLNRYKDFEPLGIKDCIIIGWSGMRGIVFPGGSTIIAIIDGRWQCISSKRCYYFPDCCCSNSYAFDSGNGTAFVD